MIFLTDLALKKCFNSEQVDILTKSGNVVQIIEHAEAWRQTQITLRLLIQMLKRKVARMR
ncbi:hypothetical protein A3L14_01810 [Thermococcus thioreducens]|uniref:Uncharacterized protein n=1 Tax=Thermococcus thioreducens TaxID=277988 RepID=A0A2Z2N189_9EURY|nr:hypothetical protein A3L14_01810 [Thermococcus thioreducens]